MPVEITLRGLTTKLGSEVVSEVREGELVAVLEVAVVGRILLHCVVREVDVVII